MLILCRPPMQYLLLLQQTSEHQNPINLSVYLVMFFVLFHHGNFTFPGEKWVSYFIITPYLHRAHHSTLREEHDSNYGIVLSCWDMIFGTRKELVPASIGLDMIEAENLVQLFSLVFLTERKLARFLHLLPRRK